MEGLSRHRRSLAQKDKDPADFVDPTTVAVRLVRNESKRLMTVLPYNFDLARFKPALCNEGVARSQWIL